MSQGAETNPPSGEPAGACCPVHPEAPATGVCARCGAFSCDACLTATTAEGDLCPACLAAVDLDGLDDFVAARRGRPDAYVGWLGGFLALSSGASFVLEVGIVGSGRLFPALRVSVALALAIDFAGLVAGVAYLRRKRWSRFGMFVPLLAAMIQQTMRLVGAGTHLPGTSIASAVLGSVFELGLVGLLVAAWRSPLNRLAFDLVVPRPRLEAAYRAYRANRLAVIALVLAVPTALVPFGFLVPLAPASVAWWRSRRPGVGRRGLARAAAILCLVGILVTAVLLVLAWLLNGR